MAFPGLAFTRVHKRNLVVFHLYSDLLWIGLNFPLVYELSRRTSEEEKNGQKGTMTIGLETMFRVDTIIYSILLTFLSKINK